MRRLIALDLPGGDAFVAELRRAWDAGDAVLPVHRQLPSAAVEALLGAMGAHAVVDGSGERSLPSGRPVEDGDALVIATSGSTGEPKGVVLTHDAVAASAAATSSRIGATAADHWLACLPLAHVGGLSVVLRALHTGAALTVLPAFDADAVMSAAAAGATLTSLVVTTLRRIDPAVFRRIVVGGSHPPDEIPPNVVTTYGLTETGSGVVYDGIPLDGVDVRVSEGGQILVRGPMLLRAYRDGTTPLDADGWLHTGDLGRWVEPELSDVPGGTRRLHVDGRAGDLVITGGENVWPDVVERALATHPSVRDVGVAGVPDAEWGQRLVAWIVPTVAADPPSLAALREHLAPTLPGFMAPRELELVESLPRTALGKLRRAELTRRRAR